MGSSTVLWAGKHLTDDEELRVRRVMALLERTGHDQGAEELAAFLPEAMDEWTPDQLEAGAHQGPWLSFGARADSSGS
jgi:hypothetical protein